jgi:predicted nucleotidyltransferase
MDLTLESYRNKREQLLAEIIAKLTDDERFIAGWLTGSYSRNENDEVSDLDLTVVVAETFSKSLCAIQEQVSHKTTDERFALFCQFGTPSLIHENNNNAPEGGTFTFVLYGESAIMVDWILVPHSKAVRPHESRSLFEKEVIPISSPPKPDDLEQSRKSVTENWAFFWMMMAITIKYIIRGDGVFVTQWIENLHGLLQEIERKIDREPWEFKRGPRNQLQTTREKQIDSLRFLCEQMLEMKSRVKDFTGTEPASPSAEIETLLSFADNHQSEI